MRDRRHRVLALVLCASSAAIGCSAILGIGDLPAPPADGGGDGTIDQGPQPPTDGGGDAADVVDSGKPDTGISCTDASLCGTKCVDLRSDLANCGQCSAACGLLEAGATSCTSGACFTTVDVSVTKAWSMNAPGPYLAFWKDGTLHARDPAGNNVTISNDPQNPVKTTFTAGANRETIYIPPSMNKTEVVLSHYGSFDAHKQDGGLAWSNGVHGCCGSGPGPFPVDPVAGRMYTGHGITEFDLADGSNPRWQDVWWQHGSPFYVTASFLYLPTWDGYLSKYARGDLSPQWKTALGTTGDGGVTSGATNAAITASGDVIATLSNGWLTRVNGNNSTPWTTVADATTWPILTSTGLVIVGANKVEQDSLCAYDAANGAQKWCTALPDKVADMFSADDGIIYVAIANLPHVRGYDRATGALRYEFTNAGYPQEMLLRGGRIYAWGSGAVTAFDVPAKKYDASNWPTRFHDNQRTNGDVSTLDY